MCCRSNEEISETLEKGTYYVEVLPQGNAKTNYLLDIFASGSGPDIDGGPVPGTSLYNDIGALTEDYSRVDNVGFGNGSRYWTHREASNFFRAFAVRSRSGG